MSTESTYNKIRGYLKTGDIVLFSGKGGISAGIKWGTLSRWSHVGMILSLEEYDFVTIWESTTISNINNLETNLPKKGVQLVPLSSRVNKYKGDIAIRQLNGVHFSANNIKDLMALRREVSSRPYEESTMELIRAAYDGPLGHNNEEDLSSLFCSELVAEAYQRLGLLNDKKPSNEYTPADFSEKKGLKLLNGSLGQEIVIKDE